MRSGAAAILALMFAGAGLVSAAMPGQLAAAPEDRLLAPGKLKLAGRTMRCGSTPTLMSSTFWDYGGATKGRIILNPDKLSGLPKSVRLWVYAHECGHQVYGAHETRADCYAIRRGRKERWLDQTGMDQICTFLKDLPGDWVHPAGPKRCEAMRQCFDKAKPQRVSR